MSWISAETKPPINLSVIGWGRVLGDGREHWYEVYWSGSVWVSVRDHREVPMSSITHWMHGPVGPAEFKEKSLIDATNLLCHAAELLPPKWDICLRMNAQECCLELEDPRGNDIMDAGEAEPNLSQLTVFIEYAHENDKFYDAEPIN